MANLGVPELRLVRPVCRVSTPESRKFALHASDILQAATTYDSLREAVADCTAVIGTSARRRMGGAVASWTLEQAADELSARRRGRLAVVFGNEKNGLANDEIELCEVCIRLATPGPYPSYNLSHAVAVTLHGLVRADRLDPPDRRVAASQRELDGLNAVWLETLGRVGYFRRTTRVRFAPKLRRLLGRIRLSRIDVNTLRGMLAHIDRALGPP